MRPYIPGEDLTNISVWEGDKLEEGGMIAINPSNPKDKWYVAKKFFQENYVEETLFDTNRDLEADDLSSVLSKDTNGNE